MIDLTDVSLKPNDYSNPEYVGSQFRKKNAFAFLKIK